jgi:hypothetical protein
VLGGAAALLPAAAAKADDQASSVASSRMSYSRFLEYLDMGRVKKVRACVARGYGAGTFVAHGGVELFARACVRVLRRSRAAQLQVTARMPRRHAGR